MKRFFSLPKSKEQEQFYSRYASLVPTLDKLGYLAQVVSALTEFGVIYTIVYGSIAPLWPELAAKAAIGGAIVGTLFLEIGLRKFAPYSARAVMLKRFGSWDGWISGFVILATVGLLIVSGLLSFKGSRLLVDAVAPNPKIVGTASADSTLSADQSQTRAYYSELIEATRQTAGAEIIELDAAYTALLQREARTGQRYTTAKANNRQRLEQVRADRGRKLAELHTQQAEALNSHSNSHQARLRDIDQINKRASAEAVALLNSYGGNLGYFTLFCLLIFIVSVTIKELHRAGAGVVEQIEPGAYDFEVGPFSALLSALWGRADRLAYGIVHKIEEGTTDAPEPVAPPTVWKRERDGLIAKTSREGVRRKIKPVKRISADVPNKRRAIGFDRPNDKPSPPGNALTQCVSDAIERSPADTKIGACDHCGKAYTMRTTWQRFCSDQCRKDHHAAKHDGRPFDPNFKPWNNA